MTYPERLRATGLSKSLSAEAGSARLGLALHKAVQEGGEGEVAEGVAAIDDRRARQQRACHRGRGRVRARAQRGQLPPGRALRARV